MPDPLRLALIAHDQKKDDLVAFVAAHAGILTRLAIVYDIPMALNRATAEILLKHHEAA